MSTIPPNVPTLFNPRVFHRVFVNSSINALQIIERAILAREHNIDYLVDCALGQLKDFQTLEASLFSHMILFPSQSSIQEKFSNYTKHKLLAHISPEARKVLRSEYTKTLELKEPKE